jgi:malonyl-CoA decarboxylase
MGWLHKALDAGAVGSACRPAPPPPSARCDTLLAACARPPGPSCRPLTQPGLAALPADAHHALWRLAALYLVHRSPQPGGDPVARFHLDNGARLERLNAQANLSPKGLKQSAG